MKLASQIGLAVGLLVMSGLVAWQGVGEILGLLGSMGAPLLLVPLAWLPSVVPAVASWRALFAPGRRPSFVRVTMAMWMGRAVNTLLPVATIGGEVVKARVVALAGIEVSAAAASVVVDKTVQALTVIAWGTTGAVALALLAVDDTLVLYTAAGMTLLAGGIVGFVLVQRAGLFGFGHRLVALVARSERWERLGERARAVDERVRETWARRRALALSLALRYLSDLLMVAEVWVAAALLGVHLDPLEAVMLRSLSATLNDVAFVIPNGYGIQEGGFVLLGALLGQDAAVMLALSLALRLRELLFDVPGLLAWQHLEGRAFVARRRRVG